MPRPALTEAAVCAFRSRRPGLGRGFWRSTAAPVLNPSESDKPTDLIIVRFRYPSWRRAVVSPGHPAAQAQVSDPL